MNRIADWYGANCHIAKFALPLIKELKEKGGHPERMSKGEWNEILNKIIYSLQTMVNDEITNSDQEGFELFGKYFKDLWD